MLNASRGFQYDVRRVIYRNFFFVRVNRHPNARANKVSNLDVGPVPCLDRSRLDLISKIVKFHVVYPCVAARPPSGFPNMERATSFLSLPVEQAASCLRSLCTFLDVCVKDSTGRRPEFV